MFCPKCGGKMVNTSTVYNAKDGENYHKRCCIKCQHRIYTIEFEVEPTGSFFKSFNEAARRRRSGEYLKMRNRELLEAYNNGTSISYLSEKYDLEPTTIYRIISEVRKHDKT